MESDSQYLRRLRAWWGSAPPSAAERLFAQRVLFDAAVAAAVADQLDTIGWWSS